MVKLYTKDKVLVSKKEIITEITDAERVLLTLKKNQRKSIDRRQFMMFSTILTASMIFPTKSEAWVWWLIRPALTFIFRREATTAVVRSAGTTAVRLGSTYRNASRSEQIKKVERVKNTFETRVGLSLNPTAVRHAADVITNNETKIIWDREGYHKSSKTQEEFKNIAWLKIENKTNQYIQTKIKLALLSGQSQQTFKRRYELQVGPEANEKVDVSHLYQNLPKNGIQYIIYELESHQNKIRISSPNKKIYVTNLIT